MFVCIYWVALLTFAEVQGSGIILVYISE